MILGFELMAGSRCLPRAADTVLAASRPPTQRQTGPLPSPIPFHLAPSSLDLSPVRAAPFLPDSTNRSSEQCPPTTRRFQRRVSAWLTDCWLGLGRAGGAVVSKLIPSRLSILDPAGSILNPRDPPSSRPRESRIAGPRAPLPCFEPSLSDSDARDRSRVYGLGFRV
jgi:hypothetical protein